MFEDLDLRSTKLGRTEQAKNDIIVKVLSHLNEIDFELYQSDSDVLGDAYEYLIGKFAAGAGKKAGEFYTRGFHSACPQRQCGPLARTRQEHPPGSARGRHRSVYGRIDPVPERIALIPLKRPSIEVKV